MNTKKALYKPGQLVRHKRYGYRGVVVLICMSVLTGCANFIHGTTQSIGISSNPTGALVTINDVSFGRTPVIVDLKRKEKNHIVKIELEGYKPADFALTRKVSGWVWGNVALSIYGLPGLLIDANSGGMYKLTPEQIRAELEREKLSRLPSEDDLYIGVVSRADPEWEKVAQLQKM